MQFRPGWPAGVRKKFTMTRPTDAFPGVIRNTVAESTPWWPETASSEKRPNVMLVILDDTGWADLGCFGSEIATPAIDSLAAAHKTLKELAGEVLIWNIAISRGIEQMDLSGEQQTYHSGGGDDGYYAGLE